MSKTKKIAVIMVMAILLPQTSIQAKTVTRQAVIMDFQGNTLKYRKCVNNTTLKGNEEWQWENLVGYGKLKQVKMASNCRFYLLKGVTKVYRVSKVKFKKKILGRGYISQKSKENGVVFYDGMAVKLIIKNGKCVKVIQQYQA